MECGLEVGELRGLELTRGGEKEQEGDRTGVEPTTLVIIPSVGAQGKLETVEEECHCVGLMASSEAPGNEDGDRS